MQEPNRPPYPTQTPPPPEAPRRRHRGRVARFFRGYLMIAGALATAYALERLLVQLFVEIGKWLGP
ncbi:MAG: hypothetical protein GX418_14245 [Clostridiales bacterium]|nr:hypothetical protein [Clostridiales bacterium]